MSKSLDGAFHTYNYTLDPNETVSQDDAAWILGCSFLILTMQTGFAMLECGCVSAKNMANIMIKNVVDVSLGGVTYWMFGYGISFGKPSNAFMGMGSFFFRHSSEDKMGSEYSHYFFQLSFATTATTIVSGAVAERMKLHAYMVFSLVNTVVYCFPASWGWGETGFLRAMGFYDYAGVCLVHLCGGTSALVSILMLGPRHDRFKNPELYAMSSPVTALTGMFMLMWAWLAFNCGSTFGVEGQLWKIGSLVAATTINGAIGGGLAGLTYTSITTGGKVHIHHIINTVLGGLVGVTGGASVYTPWQALLVGATAGMCAIGGDALLVRLKIDDPVGAVPVHFCASLFGTLAIGLIGHADYAPHLLSYREGLFYSGDFYLLGIQSLAALCVIAWSGIMTFIFLTVIKYTMGIRVSIEEEMLGADYVEHDLNGARRTEKLEAAMKYVKDETKQDQALRIILQQLFSHPTTFVDTGHRMFGGMHTIVVNKDD